MCERCDDDIDMDLWDRADDAYERVKDERLEQLDYERRNA